MGCNCGGSQNTRVIEAQNRARAAAAVAPLTGPKAPGYTWDGPEGASEKTEKQPAK